MRILHVHSGNIFGGVERILLALAGHRAVSPKFDHCFALCFDDRLGEELRLARAKVMPLGALKLTNPAQVIRARTELRLLMREEKYDAVVTHSAWTQAAFGPALKCSGAPVVFWLHTNAKGNSAMERAAQFYFPDAIISVSQWVDGSAAKLFPGVKSYVVHAPLALDRDAFAKADRTATRAALGVREDEALILQASRMEEWKGHRDLIKSLRELGTDPNWTCCIAGGAERPDEIAYLEELREMVKAFGLETRVRFLGQRNDVPALLMASDIYCQANTEAEGFSIAFVEAFYAGVPIVTSALGGALEIVDETCGILVPPHDPTAVATALRSLIQDAIHRRKLGAMGRERALQICDPARQFRALETVFTEVTSRHV